MHSPKIVQKFIGIVLSATMAFSGLTACQDTYDNNTDDTSDHENNNENGNNNQQQNNQFSEYSKLLQNVLNNEHYDELINRARGGNTDLYKTGEFAPHPYAFLEDEGFDVEGIKSGDIEAYTMSYVLNDEPNNLYMYTRVMQNNSYYTTYLLQYKLTEEEMEDYQLLHSGYGDANFYIQSVFINNEISKMKTPTIVGKSNMSIEAFEGMTNHMGKQDYVDSQSCHIIFTNPNLDDCTFDVKVIPKFYNDYQAAFSGTIVNLDCLGQIHMNNDVFIAPYTSFIPEVLSKQNATFYFIQDALLHIGQCKNFESHNPSNQ